MNIFSKIPNFFYNPLFFHARESLQADLTQSVEKYQTNLLTGHNYTEHYT